MRKVKRNGIRRAVRAYYIESKTKLQAEIREINGGDPESGR
jgi:hypothetical protein